MERDLQGTGITVGQRAILETLSEAKSATAPMLTDWLDMKRQFVARELKALLEAGMIEKTPNPDRARSFLYRLTAESSELIGAIREREIRSFAAFSDQFTEDELLAFRKIMEALYANMLTEENLDAQRRDGARR
ncbi:MarR family winged helix-turn-helix transcriptional regulator [Rhodovulum sp. YEN HP10]|uniref:MarR family winged helix-turn-helix transcriptional regulator n=1 Tax=Rhodovulum sp. HP10 TaxID=3387397 RepID=UPI0039E161DB